MHDGVDADPNASGSWAAVETARPAGTLVLADGDAISFSSAGRLVITVVLVLRLPEGK
jgi:hypothetical protein